MEKNKLTMVVIGALIIGGLIGAVIGYQLTARNIVQPKEVLREQILAEIDQRVEEKARIGILPLMIMQEMPIERYHLAGEVVLVDMEANRFNVKARNTFEGGSFTEFLFQPAYFTKEIILTPETEIRKSVFPLMDPMMMEDEMMMDPMFWEPQEIQLSVAELLEIITTALEAEELLHFSVETEEAFILGQVELLTARTIHFTYHQ